VPGFAELARAIKAAAEEVVSVEIDLNRSDERPLKIVIGISKNWNSATLIRRARGFFAGKSHRQLL
jgi:hypothetical protein